MLPLWNDEEWEAILEDVIQGTTPPGKRHFPAEDPGDGMDEPERLPTVEEDEEAVANAQGTLPTGGGTLKNTSNGLRTAALPFPYPAAGGPSLPPSTTQSLPVSRKSSMAPTSRQLSVVDALQTPAGVPHREGLSDVAPATSSGDGVQGVSSGATPTEGAASATRSRSMTRSTTALHRALSEGDGPGREKRRALDPLVLDATTVEVLLAEDSQHHPLVKAVNQAREDIANNDLNLGDHGTWDGRWSWPGRYRYMAMQEQGMMLPPGGEVLENEVNLASAHKEIQWSSLSQDRKDTYQMAANDQWSKWLDNAAVEVLTLAESRAVRQELEKRGELERILKPRWVLTDKNKSLRTRKTRFQKSPTRG